jgi:hypothetical protein
LFLLAASNDWYIAELYGHKVRVVSGSTGALATIAGTGIASFSGDGGAATSATLNQPFGLWVASSSGSIFIADTYNHSIRVVDGGGSGVISTIADTGNPAFSGDGGLATDAALSFPTSVLGGADGSESFLYVSDMNNHRIRTLSLFTPTMIPTAVPTPGPTAAPSASPTVLPDLFISTLAGTGPASSMGDGGAASVATINGSGQTWIHSAQQYLYIVENSGQKVRRVELNSGGGNSVSTFARTGTGSSTGDGGQTSSATLNGPHGVHGDNMGHVFICEPNAHQVRVVNTSSAIIEKYAGTTDSSGATGDGGAATSAQLNNPHFLAGDTPGNLFIADRDNQKIRKVTYSTGIISTYTGTAPARRWTTPMPPRAL